MDIFFRGFLFFSTFFFPVLSLLAETSAKNPAFDPVQKLETCNVVWDSPGPSALQSMPIGNGDIGLNVWVETNGDLLFYIVKTDSWGERVKSSYGLMKIGKVRVSLTPPGLGQGISFSQTLKLHEAEILIREGEGKNGIEIRVWVDANHPVVRIELKNAASRSVKVQVEPWRTAPADTILTEQKNRIVWYHRNSEKGDPQVAGLTFGALMRGEGLVSNSVSIERYRRKHG